ncbi:MAG: ATP-dependent DNA ligase [Myxococcota bacterium]
MHRLVSALEAVKATRSRKAKIARLAALLSEVSVEELPLTSRLVLGQILRQGDVRTLGVGWALLAQATASAAGTTANHVGIEARQAGDVGDAVAKLLPARGQTVALRQVESALEAIADTADRDEKLERLTLLLSQAAPEEAGYLARALLGEVRIGVQQGTFEEAVALAFSLPLEEVRRAAALVVDPGDLARLAKEGRLGEAGITPGRVIAFMLATPTEAVKEPVDPSRTIFEDKLDGVRAQVHVVGGTVRIFARGQDEVTQAFPEVVAALATLPRAVVLDGEIIAVGSDGRARPFQALQARLGRKEPDATLRARVPVAFIAYDCLYDGQPLLSRPWTERRARLEALGVAVNPVGRFDTARPLEAQVDDAFTAARARGNEGLVLKRVDAPYEAGRRGSAWRKVKRAFATLDVVVTRAEWGHGKRRGVLSDYTFAVWRGDRLAEIGKAFSGLTDAEIARLTTRFLELTLSRIGNQHLVRPVVVLEVAFDGLQRSSRHDSGFSLRFPRIVRIRDDKRPEDADRLETAQALFAAQVDSGHREEDAQGRLFDVTPTWTAGPDADKSADHE